MCHSIYSGIQVLKMQDKENYKMVSAVLRLPYQVFYNNMEFMSIISEMTESTFEYYFRRIVHIHRKCPKAEGGHCSHLLAIHKALEPRSSA